ncbi:rhomboid family intramembrane serine protease [Candidatus Woesearchaeota archaeon]|nr:rhomboid family intramembrane serine protease [Candidatus Woesearchaeota archaeon]
MNQLKNITKSAVLTIAAVNCIIFLVQAITGGLEGWFTQMFILVGSDVFTRPWILLTSMFLHASPMHLFFNIWALVMFGPLVEQRIGTLRFYIIYFLSGLLASFISSFFYNSALGASGAIMGIIGATIILLPQLRILFFFIIPMPLWVGGIVWAAMDFFGLFYPSGVGNIAHLVGLGCGLIYALTLRGKKIRQSAKFSQKNHLNDEDIDEYFRYGRI